MCSVSNQLFCCGADGSQAAGAAGESESHPEPDAQGLAEHGNGRTRERKALFEQKVLMQSICVYCGDFVQHLIDVLSRREPLYGVRVVQLCEMLHQI